ncbi:CBN-SULP-2 protein [Caenorhabditis brenneri]|uniref:CBN-SULP-2 protein n=1 Tax=Caenorhabditis brenneri TaxID=135651 RepID=G0M6H2_CAEBE|nr:CBN-SULP-2 protein [Caenorhabditis brenneri]
MNQEDYDRQNGFNREEPPNWIRRKWDRIKEGAQLSGVGRMIEHRIPIIGWLRRYAVTDNLLPDVVAGTTVGIYVVAQDYPGVTNIEIAASLCLLTGMIQICLALTKFDVLMTFLPKPAVDAITVSAVFYGIVSQIPKILGFSVKSSDAPYFSLFHSVYEIGVNIVSLNINWPTAIVSFVTLVYLIITQFFEKLWKRSFKAIPFPRELIMLALAIILSDALNLDSNYHVKTIKTIPSGFQSPLLPRLDIMSHLFLNAVSVAVVSYAITISMGDVFSRKHNYIMDTNQELLALGLTNFGSSFFGCFPTCCSLSRTLVNEKCGAKTQLASIVSSAVIGIVVIFLGTYLTPLPICVLSVLVCFVVIPFLVNAGELPRLWKCSKHDFATEFRIIRFDAPLIFTNVKKFSHNIRSAMQDTKKRRKSIESQEGVKWTAIILDCHTWTYTDTMGITAVQDINEDLQKLHILPLFANLKSSLRRQYERAGILEEVLVYEHEVLELEVKVMAEDRRITEERDKLARNTVRYANGTNRKDKIDPEAGLYNGEAVQVEMKHEQTEHQLLLDEIQLNKEKRCLAAKKEKLAQQIKETERKKEGKSEKNAESSMKISQNQIYPSIQDALKAAHELVIKQNEFFKERVQQD